MMGRELPFILNLANSIMGVSLLAMPFCFMRCGILLGTVLLLMSTLLTTITCGLLVKAGIASKRRSYEFLAYDLFGASGKLAVEVGITGVQLGICIAFHVIIGDLGPSLLSKWSGVQNNPMLRMIIMVISALTVSLPLSLMRNLESITKLSVLSICFYIVVVASVFATSWPNLIHGRWIDAVDIWNTNNIFQCLPIFAMAFGCQTQMFILYEALPEPSLSALNSITKNGVSLCTVVYLVTGFFGYIAFYDKDIGGDILLSFPPSFGADLLKFGFVLSVALSFPLMVFPCRQSLNTLLFSTSRGLSDSEIWLNRYQRLPASPEVACKNESLHKHAGFTGTAPMSSNKFNGLTGLIIVGTLCIGINFPNVEFVIGLNGSTMGCLISFIFPAVMFLKVVGSRGEGSFQAKVVLLVGILTLCLSTYSTIQNAERATEFRDAQKLDVTTGLATFIPIRELEVEPKKPPNESKQSTKQSEDLQPEQQESPNEDKTDKHEANDPEATRKEPPNPQPPNSHGDEDVDKRIEPPNPVPERSDDNKINEKGSKVAKKVTKKSDHDNGEADNVNAGEGETTTKKKVKHKKTDKIKNEGGNKTEESLKSDEDNEETKNSINKLIKKLDQQAELNKDLLEQNQVLIEGLKEIKKEKESLESDGGANKVPAMQQGDVQQAVGRQPLQQQGHEAIGQLQGQQPVGQQQGQQAMGQQPIGQQQSQQSVGQQQSQQAMGQQPIGQQQGQQSVAQQQGQQALGQQPIGQQQGQQPIGQQPVGQQQGIPQQANAVAHQNLPAAQQQATQPVLPEHAQQPVAQDQEVRDQPVKDSFIKDQENKLAEVEHKQKIASNDAQELKKSLKQIVEKGENNDRRAKRDVSNDRGAMYRNGSEIVDSNIVQLQAGNMPSVAKNGDDPVRVSLDNNKKSPKTNKPVTGNAKEEV